MNEKSIRTFLLLLLCLVLVRGLIYGLVIPADQYPDEFHHFGLIKSKQLELNSATEQERRETAARIAYSSYYLRYPETTRQRTIDEFKGAGLPSPFSSLHAYYFVTAWLLKIFSIEQIVHEFYLLRAFSTICGMLVVAIAFFSARKLFPEDAVMTLGVPVFITFIPQFSAMNGAISNDKLTEVFAALAFLFMVKILKDGMHAGNFLMLTGIICLAILSKRSSLFLIPVFLLFIILYWWRDVLGIKMHVLLLVFFGSSVLGLYFLIQYVPAVESFVIDHITWAPAYKITRFLSRPELYSLDALKHYLKFFTVMYWSFWGVFGYMTIHLHHFWYLAAAVIQCLAICGVTWRIFLAKVKKYVLPPWKSKVLYLFGGSIFWAVLIPFLRSNIFRGDFVLSQGRYLFPVLIPISILTLFGLRSILPAKSCRTAAFSGALALLVLDMVCLSKYLLLNFHYIDIF